MTRADRKLKIEEIADYIHSLDSYTLDSVARHFSVSKSLVKQAIDESGVPKPQRKFNRPNLDRDRYIIEDYERGITMQEIGNRYNISKQRVYQILLREGKINHNKKKFTVHSKGTVPFNGLRGYLNTNQITCAELSYLISQHIDTNVGPSQLRNMLQDYNHMSYKVIKAILDVTGLKFEKCFNVDGD